MSDEPGRVLAYEPITAEVSPELGPGCLGALIGGVLVPFCLLVIAGILGDIGGFCFWPALVMVGTVAGACIGKISSIIACWIKSR